MNRTTLVAAFAAALFSTAAVAQSSEEQQACMNDAFRVCSHTIPDRNRTAACMFQNMSQLSPACQVVMNKYAPGGTLSASVASRPAAPMMSKAVMTKPAAMKTASSRPGKPLNILMR
jgi:hypothetical protein